MGVNTFLLDRRSAVLSVGSSKQTVGTLRRFFKLTELTPERAAEREAAAFIEPSPPAVILMDVADLPLAATPQHPVAAHLVLGWEKGRGSVTDLGWDYLPRLGYAVRDPATSEYVLHEEHSGMLHDIDRARASELKLLDEHGKLVARGQLLIQECLSVRQLVLGYAEADCILEDGRHERLLVEVANGVLPKKAWFAGKKPMQVERYPSSHDSP